MEPTTEHILHAIPGALSTMKHPLSFSNPVPLLRHVVRNRRKDRVPCITKIESPPQVAGVHRSSPATVAFGGWSGLVGVGLERLESRASRVEATRLSRSCQPPSARGTSEFGRMPLF